MTRNVEQCDQNIVSQQLAKDLMSPSGYKIKKEFFRFFNNAINALVPRRCSLCDQYTDKGFCDSCLRLLPFIIHPCEGCGVSMHADFGTICGSCQNTKQLWSHIVAPLEYTEPAASLIQQLKYGRRQYLAYSMAKIMSSGIIKSGNTLPDIIVPVPAYRDKLVARGYNQAQVIAKELGKLLEIPVYNSLIIKTRKTLSQTQIDLASRQKNLKGVFEVNNNDKISADLSIAVVDDVITSGATMRTICKELRSSGYNRISSWAFARASVHH